MRIHSRSGFSLVELIVAVLLSSVILVGLMSILTPLVLSQAFSARAQTVQLNLAAVNEQVEKELRQASLVSQPLADNFPTNTLEGCDNAAGSPPAPIDPNPPPPIDPITKMRWFAFCAAGGTVYYHSGNGCPGIYTCGTSPTAAFRWPQPWSTLMFTRATAASTLVTISLSGASGSGAVVMSTSAVAFSAAAGGEQ
ncbi:MAG: type II secretion system protein J [Elusimicrobiota bacterium]